MANSNISYDANNATLQLMTSANSSYDAVCKTMFEHYLLLSVVLFVCVFGILGNTLVIVATMHSKAFSGDNISIIFVRNLAIADLLYIFVQVGEDINISLRIYHWNVQII